MSERKDITTRQESISERNIKIPTVAPLVDIYENDEEILLHADMPGVKKEEITINIDNGRLELSGIRKMETSGATGWEEFGEVEYQRVFSVPQSIDVGKVNAELSDGVLKLHLPKAEAAKPRVIEIKAA
ncbi:Hsp20/alpha crystallin family protein [Desulfopila aestuarii]|uniref:Molecular chaperone IbpA, HSP20 family n=1 Tax=Desulfopila aestuarii DSM 18488 TaxID=1121416 RepID=A0A1M7XYC9_9BACT|nr:Hsp20/alpha crystallin family protein [Desulfopila aestuarii]SHO43996.1 Molecular chaperone IbpA, HSP20 family [Desulfopila aestuarii DSM 18488]